METIYRSKLLFSCKLFYHNKSKGKRLLFSSIENTVCFILDDVIDICFPGQETVTNHPAHESGFNKFVKTQCLSRKLNQINHDASLWQNQYRLTNAIMIEFLKMSRTYFFILSVCNGFAG